MSYVCPNPSCRKTKCYDHCNHCGKDIFWRPPLLDKEIFYQGPKPLNQNGSVHRCMLKGTRDGQYYHTDTVAEQKKSIYPRVKASVIICADSDCNFATVERTEPLAEMYQKHLQRYHNFTLKEEFINMLKFKIDYLRNGHFSYIDPFLHIPWEDIQKNVQ